MDIDIQYIERSKLFFASYQSDAMKAAPPYSINLGVCFVKCFAVKGFSPKRLTFAQGSDLIAKVDIQDVRQACNELLDIVLPNCNAEHMGVIGDYKGFQTVVTFHLQTNEFAFSMDASNTEPPFEEFVEQIIPIIDNVPLLGADDKAINLTVETGVDGVWIARYYASSEAYKYMPSFSMPIKDTLDNIFRIQHLSVYQTRAYAGDCQETFPDFATTWQMEDFCRKFSMQRIQILAYYLGEHMAIIDINIRFNRIIVSLPKEEDDVDQNNKQRTCELAEQVAIAVHSASPRVQGKEIDYKFQYEFVNSIDDLKD